MGNCSLSGDPSAKQRPHSLIDGATQMLQEADQLQHMTIGERVLAEQQSAEMNISFSHPNGQVNAVTVHNLQQIQYMVIALNFIYGRPEGDCLTVRLTFAGSSLPRHGFWGVG